MERGLQLALPYAKPFSEKQKRLIDRIQFFASTIVYLATLPLSIPLWGIGFGLDVLSKKWGTSAFSYIKGKAPQKIGDVERIATWNVCMLPLGLPIAFGGMAPLVDRVDDVAAQIIRSNADLVSLQEVSPYAAELLIKKLQDNYSEFYIARGLLVASKIHIKEGALYQLPYSGFVDRVLFSFKVNRLSFFTTQLDPHSAEHRNEQISQINFGNGPAIFLGDLNMKRGEEPLPTGFQDTLSPKSITATDRFMGDETKDVSIDYILGREVNLTSSIFETYDSQAGWANSDHKMIVSQIT